MIFNTSARQIYTVKNNNQYVCCKYHDKRYLIAFRSVHHARHVQYNLQPDPKIITVNDTKRQTLIIQKNKSAHLHPVDDMGYWVGSMSIDYVSRLPSEQGIGVVLLQELLQENSLWFTFGGVMIDPPEDGPTIVPSTIQNLEKLL